MRGRRGCVGGRKKGVWERGRRGGGREEEEVWEGGRRGMGGRKKGGCGREEEGGVWEGGRRGCVGGRKRGVGGRKSRHSDLVPQLITQLLVYSHFIILQRCEIDHKFCR